MPDLVDPLEHAAQTKRTAEQDLRALRAHARDLVCTLRDRGVKAVTLAQEVSPTVVNMARNLETGYQVIPGATIDDARRTIIAIAAARARVKASIDPLAAEIRAAHLAGRSYGSIAQQLGLSASAVQQYWIRSQTGQWAFQSHHARARAATRARRTIKAAVEGGVE
jgi:hypothetical protein